MSLRITRAKERAEKGLVIFHLAKEICGDAAFSVEIESEDLHPREVRITIKHKETGASVTVELDGNSPFRDGAWLLSWHGVRDPYRFAPHFAFGNVNVHHGRKATDSGKGFDALCETLRQRLAVIRSGSAFCKVTPVEFND